MYTYMYMYLQSITHETHVDTYICIYIYIDICLYTHMYSYSTKKTHIRIYSCGGKPKKSHINISTYITKQTSQK